jgi:glycosyltransferase involved in cell wall biosynthesis/uncharacterized membrane protein YbhN (UPF0104 family)
MRVASGWSRLRFALSWIAALALVVVGVPRVVNVSWRGVVPVLESLPWTAVIALIGVWLLGLFVHSFVLTAAAPSLSRRRAMTLNVTGSAVSNVVPLGGAAGVELNRRMMRSWGIDTRTFTGFTFLTNLWDIGAKLLLPVVAVIALVRSGVTVTAPLQLASLVGALVFTVVVALAATLLLSPRWTIVLGRSVEAGLKPARRLFGGRTPDVTGGLLEIRRECGHLVANGWLRMTLGISGYVALQGLLLGLCLHLTGAGTTATATLAGFAVERMLTIVPITPGGVGIADLGLVGVLLTLGGDPAGVTAAAVLFRAFIFLVEIPVGGGALGLWLLGRRHEAGCTTGHTSPAGAPCRIAHVTDVFLPRLGGIETHVDDLVRHQRAMGLDVEVLTPAPAATGDPSWVRRLSSGEARGIIGDYDVVHVHLSLVSPYGIAVARAATRAGVPTLMTVHSMWSGAGGVVRLAALAGLRRWPVVWSAVSVAAAETFGRSLGGADVAVLPNAIDVADWRHSVAHGPTARLRGRAAGGPQPHLTVVSVMRLMPRKRPMQLLRVFEQIRRLTPDHDVQLLIVGDGPLRRRMERFVERRGLTSCVRITGRIPRSDVAGELMSASVYVSPAPKESFGIAALEARCAGLPVVAHRRSGVTEFIRDRVDGILVADDAEMAVALADLVIDGELRDRITLHNRAVAPPFDWTDVLDRTDALYVAASKRMAAPRRGVQIAGIPSLAMEA